MKRHQFSRHFVLWWCATFAVMVCCPMALGQTLPKNRRATISPSIKYLEPGQEQKFKVVMIATRLMAADVPKEVKWSVNDIPGGNAAVGTIDAAGLYKAPATAPAPREIHIVAEVPEAANKVLFATVIIGSDPPRYKSLRIWSEPVVNAVTKTTEHMTDPHGIGLDADGNILIADQLGCQVLRYTPEGKYLGQLGKGKGSEPGQFTEPRIVMSDASGRIIVTDSKGDRPRIQVFSKSGEFLQIFAEKGMKPGMILRAHGMGLDTAQRLFTIDVDNMRVNVYSPSGEFLYDWGTEGLDPGQFNAPHGLFVDRSGDVFVTGYYGPTQKFNSEGDFILAFCHGDPPDGPVYFHNVCGDKWGNVYVMVRTKEGYQGAVQRAESEAKRISIMKYNNNGDFVTAWGFSTTEHRETTAEVDSEGRVYALFKGETEMGVETFVPE